MFKLDQLYVKVSLELNVIDTNRFFLQKEGVNQIWLHHTIGTKSDRHSQKWGSSQQNLPTMLVWEYPPPPWTVLVFLKKGCIILWYNSWPHFLRSSWVNTDSWSFTAGNLFPLIHALSQTPTGIRAQVSSLWGGRLTNWAIPPPFR